MLWALMGRTVSNHQDLAGACYRWIRSGGLATILSCHTIDSGRCLHITEQKNVDIFSRWKMSSVWARLPLDNYMTFFQLAMIHVHTLVWQTCDLFIFTSNAPLLLSFHQFRLDSSCTHLKCSFHYTWSFCTPHTSKALALKRNYANEPNQSKTRGWQVLNKSMGTISWLLHKQIFRQFETG
jgi:hypothetical protein